MASLVYSQFTEDILRGPFFRPGLSFIAGLAKEAYDLLSGDPLDTGDFTANGLGILFGVLFSPFS